MEFYDEDGVKRTTEDSPEEPFHAMDESKDQSPLVIIGLGMKDQSITITGPSFFYQCVFINCRFIGKTNLANFSQCVFDNCYGVDKP